MSAQLPAWQPLEPGAGSWIEDSSDTGRVVALLAPARSSGESWAGSATYALAAEWAEAGRRVVVADAALEEPSLHELAEIENAEGLVDAARFGSSVAHVARSVPGQAFFLITAGSPVADGASVPGSPRWRRLLDGFRQAGVTFVLFLREGGAGVQAFLRDAEDVVLLAPDPGSARVPVDGVGERIRAVLGPAAGAGPNAAATVDPEDAEPEPDRFVAPAVGGDDALTGPGGPADAWTDALSDVALPDGEGLSGLDPRPDAEALDRGWDALPERDSGLDVDVFDGPETEAGPQADALPGPDATDVPPGSWSEAPEADATGSSAEESRTAPARPPRRAREATGSSLLFWLLLGGLALAIALVLLI